MKRKRKPISQAEQSRRFLEAARAAGVDADPEALERIVRKVARPKKTVTFMATTEAVARRQLDQWKRDHPDAIIAKETIKHTTGVGSMKGKTGITLHIVYEE
jgi:hypothetical protein